MSLLNLSEIPAPVFPLTEDGVRDALVALGPSMDRVAASLYTAGHRGARCKSGGCPVASYLAKLFPHRLVAVDTLHTTVGPVVMLRNPTAVAGFVASFDMGRFPELRDEPPGYLPGETS